MTSKVTTGENAVLSSASRRNFLTLLARAGMLACMAPAVPGLLRQARASTETSRVWRAMGTLMEVRIPDLPHREAVHAIQRVRLLVEQLEAAMTLFRPQSSLVKFNHTRESRWIPVPYALAHTVARAIDAFRESRGAFDPTVAPAMRAWGLYDLKGKMPSPHFFKEWANRPRADAIEVDPANRRMRRLDSRVEVDLGGIGKGVALDAILKSLATSGSRSALVNLGGSIGVLGAPADSPEGWPVGIAHPRRPRSVWKTFFLAHGHAATSGDTERFVDTPRGRKHHLLDPVSGEPFAGPPSVTALAPTGVRADVLSTWRFLQSVPVEKAGGSRFLIYEEKT